MTESLRKIFFSTMFFFIFLFPPSLDIQNSVLYASDKLKFSAKVEKDINWCSFSNEEEQRKFYMYPHSRFVYIPCGQITDKFKEKKIVNVYLKNISNADIELNVSRDFKNIVLTSKNGQKLNPIALRTVQKPLGYQEAFYLTELDGEMKLILPQNKEDNLIFIFEKALVGQKLNLGDLFTVNLK
jgi:hypothetical protein